MLSVSPSQAWAQCGTPNPNDSVADDTALNCLLGLGGTVTLSPGSPGYIIRTGLVLSVNSTVITSSSAPTKVKIIAHADLDEFLLRTSGSVNNFSIQYVSFDGRGDDSVRTEVCDVDSPQFTPGNVYLQGSGFTFAHNESVESLCGTGLGLNGSGYYVFDNYIAYNGKDTLSASEQWSDGITALSCDDGYIYDNVLVDNTDIDLVVAGPGGCQVTGNVIYHGGKFAWAGLNLGNFTANGGGYHTGALFSENSIDSVVEDRLGMGLLVGSHAWDSSLGTAQHTVTDNITTGAAIPFVIEGAADIVNISGNTASGHQGSFVFAGCSQGSYNFTAEHFNVSGGGTLQSGYTTFQLDDRSCN